jgi:hypothetical protein
MSLALENPAVIEAKKINVLIAFEFRISSRFSRNSNVFFGLIQIVNKGLIFSPRSILFGFFCLCVTVMAMGSSGFHAEMVCPQGQGFQLKSAVSMKHGTRYCLCADVERNLKVALSPSLLLPLGCSINIKHLKV